jgi:hypothetical protein
MALTRMYDEQELPPDVRRILEDVRGSFGLPFVPTLFKLAAGVPQYLKPMWADLGPVVRSNEFQSACRALHEFAANAVLAGGWRFSDQAKVLAAQKFAPPDIAQFAAITTTIERAAVAMTLFARLAQRGYSGGQKGKITAGQTASATAQLMTLHVPGEAAGGLRTWLIYSDIKRTTGARHVFSMFRLLSAYPSYLGSLWIESKRLLSDWRLQHARDEVNKRTIALLTGMPVKDHRALAKNISPEDWREVEETIDDGARLGPQITLLAHIWRRSFAAAYQIIAA